MDFDSLLQILNGKFFIARKETFSDYFDAIKSIPLVARFGFTSFGERLSKEEYEQNEIRINEIKESARWLTSCWTETYNNILMWQAYTKGSCGVCIESTVNDFIESIKSDYGKVLYGKINYGNYSPSMSVEEYAFNKLLLYKDEREIRFYFLNDKDTKEQNETYKFSYKLFDIAPDKMIKNIILSPLIRNPNSAEMLKNLLENKFDFLKGKIKTNIIKYI
mgnify:CR=1 FL=1